MPTQDQIRSQITQQIIDALENGCPPWRQPWLGTANTGRPTNVVSEKPYRGINPLLLSLHQQRHGFRSRWYGTFKQWQDMGGKVMRRPDRRATRRIRMQDYFLVEGDQDRGK